MNILFIEPPYYRLLGEKKRWLPVGLLYLAAVLEAIGHHVGVYNADADFQADSECNLSYSERFYLTEHVLDDTDKSNYVWHEVTNVIESFNPDMIGISVKTECVPSVVRLIDLVKCVNSSIKIILGGPHFHVDPSPQYFNNVGAFVIGEAEGCITKLVAHDYSSDACSIEKGPVLSLDSLPLLNLKYALQEVQNPRLMRKQLISTSRGCPFRCSFCYKSIAPTRVRYLSGKLVTDTMLSIYNEYGIERFYIVDDTFASSKAQLLEMHKALTKHGVKFKFSCMSHVKVLNRSVIDILKDAGCVAVHLGIESGSDRMLNILKKDIKTTQIMQCASQLKSAGLELRAFMMVGLPYETDIDVDLSIKLINDICPDEVAAQVYQPYPNTALHNQIFEKNTISTTDWTKFTRRRVNYDLYPGQSIDVVEARIERFLRYADMWNGGIRA